MTIITISDLQTLARKRLPKMFYDYVEGGSWDESAIKRNRTALDDIEAIHRVCCPWDNYSCDKLIAGVPASMPLYLSPCGLTGMLRANGEVLSANAAIAMDIPYCYSMMSINHLRDIPNPKTWDKLWFQIYPLKDRKLMERLMMIAQEKGCSALVLTLDIPVLGQRIRDLRNGLSVPPKWSLKPMLQVASSPAWLIDMFESKSWTYSLLASATGGGTIVSLSRWVLSQQDNRWSWDDVDWVRKVWKGKLILKGILHPGDSLMAQQHGADAVILSNHGGRQLSFSMSPADCLSEIRKQQMNFEIMIDGGVRSGSDVARLLGLGASAVGIGRSYLYGLAVLGEEGVKIAVQIIRDEMIASHILLGVNNKPPSLH